MLDELDREEQDELDMRCLQVLRALIHNQIKQVDPELKERNPKEYRRYGCKIQIFRYVKYKLSHDNSQCKALVEPVQNQIQDWGDTMKRVSVIVVCKI